MGRCRLSLALGGELRTGPMSFEYGPGADRHGVHSQATSANGVRERGGGA